jgi:hypothetical protein
MLSRDIMVCHKCKSSEFIKVWHEHRQQYARICKICNTQKGTYPKENDKYKRPKNHTELVKKKGIEFCELCLRKKDELPPPKTLEGHHIVEYQDGGTDDVSNIMVVCTPCHKYIHHQRTYLGHYNNKPTNAS